MAKEFLVGLCVVLAFATSEGLKPKGAMEQILQANMNPGGVKILLRNMFFFLSFFVFQIKSLIFFCIFKTEYFRLDSIDIVVYTNAIFLYFILSLQSCSIRVSRAMKSKMAAT